MTRAGVGGRDELKLLFHKRAGFSLFLSLKSNTLFVPTPSSPFPFYFAQLIEPGRWPGGWNHSSRQVPPLLAPPKGRWGGD